MEKVGMEKKTMLVFPVYYGLDFILFFFFFLYQEWRRGWSFWEGGERYQGKENSQLSEEPGDGLLQ